MTFATHKTNREFSDKERSSTAATLAISVQTLNSAERVKATCLPAYPYMYDTSMTERSEPRFIQIYNDLKADLLAKRYHSQQMLPSENALCEQFSTSRQTIRSALKLLDKDGLVSNLPGKGWQIHIHGKKTTKPVGHIGHVIFLGRNDQASSLQYKGINELASSVGLSTEFIPLQTLGARNNQSIDLSSLNTKDCDGIIYFSDDRAHESVHQFVEEHKMPFVQLGHYGYQNYDTVCADYYAGCQKTVAHLHQIGYRNICFVGQTGLHTTKAVFKERLRGYREACRELKIPVKDSLLDWDHFLKPNADTELIDWLRSDGLPACVIGSAGHQFPQLIAICAQHNYQIPNDFGIMLIGDPNIEDTRNFFPGGRVSMLLEPWEALGNICIQRLAQRIQGDSSPANLSMVPLEIYSGNSTQTVH